MRRKPKLNEWIIGIVLALWILMAFFHRELFDYSPDVYGTAQIRWLKRQGVRMCNEELSEDQLRTVVTKFALLHSKVNEYIPEISYQSPTDWTVRLKPKKQRAFARGFPFLYRLIVFDFERMDFEEITIVANNNRAQQGGGEERR